MNESLNDAPINHRAELVRKAIVLQFKLLVDGLRDAALIPLALVATVLGLVRGGEGADLEFQKVIKLGRRSERWIDLFGQETHARRARPGGSLDQLLERVEAVVMEQHSRGRSTEEARSAIEAAMSGVAGEDGAAEDSAGDDSRTDHKDPHQAG